MQSSSKWNGSNGIESTGFILKFPKTQIKCSANNFTLQSACNTSNISICKKFNTSKKRYVMISNASIFITGLKQNQFGSLNILDECE